MGRGVPVIGFRKTRRWCEENGVPYLSAEQRKEIRQVTIRRRYNPGKPLSFDLPSGSTHVSIELLKRKPETTETEEQMEKRIAERFEVLSALADSAVRGQDPAVIISGPPGVGRTHEIMEKFKAKDEHGHPLYTLGVHYDIVRGRSKATGLFKMLWQFRMPGQVLVFDDCDAIFNDEDSLNLLKAACDSSPVRRVAWLSEYEFVDEEGEVIPKRFDFMGTIIFITNYDFDELCEKDKKLVPHVQALMSRAHYLDMQIKGAADCMVRIKQVLRSNPDAPQFGSPEIAKDVLDFMDEHKTSLREVSLRTVVKLVRTRKNHGENWKRIAINTQCRVR